MNVKPLLQYIAARPLLLGIGALVLTAALSSILTAWYVRSRNHAPDNQEYLIQYGTIGVQFDDADMRTSHATPLSATGWYHYYEESARTQVHYPQESHIWGMDTQRPLMLFCWAVAADRFHTQNKDIPVDPLVWHGFLSEGPKQLPLYWQLRKCLSQAGAERGLTHGESLHGFDIYKHTIYKMPPLYLPPHPF